jgi:hypothetical protein
MGFFASAIALIAPERIRDRHVLLAFIVGLAIALCWQGLTQAPGSAEALSLLRDRSGVSVAEILAFGAVLAIVFRFHDEEEFLTASDLMVLAATGAVFAAPNRLIASAPLVAVGVMFLRRQDARLLSIGQVCLALLFYEWLGQILFQVAAPLALKAETIAVWALLSPFGHFTMSDLSITGGNGHGIYIEIQCSAFHNLSAATLIWISLIKLETDTISGAHWRILAVMAGATVILNTIRIALMAQSYPMYDYWHNGTGAPIVSFTMLAGILFIFLGGRKLAMPR